MSLQKLFNDAVIGVVRQGRPGMVNGACKLRTPNGLKCAIGMLIPDDRYERRIEAIHLADLYRNVLSDLYPMEAAPVSLMGEIQNAHDFAAHDNQLRGNIAFLNDFANRTVELAKQFNLTYPHLEVELLIVRHQLATEDGAKRFDFSRFLVNENCGCIAGFIDINKRVQAVSPDGYHSTGPSGCQVIAEHLDPEKAEALNELFGVTGYMPRSNLYEKVTAAHAIQAIDNFLNTGEAKWEEIYP